MSKQQMKTWRRIANGAIVLGILFVALSCGYSDQFSGLQNVGWIVIGIGVLAEFLLHPWRENWEKVKRQRAAARKSGKRQTHYVETTEDERRRWNETASLDDSE